VVLVLQQSTFALVAVVPSAIATRALSPFSCPLSPLPKCRTGQIPPLLAGKGERARVSGERASRDAAGSLACDPPVRQAVLCPASTMPVANVDRALAVSAQDGVHRQLRRAVIETIRRPRRYPGSRPCSPAPSTRTDISSPSPDPGVSRTDVQLHPPVVRDLCSRPRFRPADGSPAPNVRWHLASSSR
jgi:hypothetical protein